MDQSEEEFADLAGPHSWLMVADNLHEQAVRLYENRGRGTVIRTDRRGEHFPRDSVNRAVFLLGGFALENALKAFLVYENPAWVSNGCLARPLRTHSLSSLHEKAQLVPYRKRFRWVLATFESGLESWARYPCALSANESRFEAAMQDRVWAGYRTVMSAYGRRLQRLLRAGWRGPHVGLRKSRFWGPTLLSQTWGSQSEDMDVSRRHLRRSLPNSRLPADDGRLRDRRR
jgi:hypothetical protein